MKTIKKINHVVALGMIAATLMFTVSCKKTNPSVPAGLPSLTTNWAIGKWAMGNGQMGNGQMGKWVNG
jgi:hypothetical protein